MWNKAFLLLYLPSNYWDQGLSCLSEVDDGFICIHIHVQSDFWTIVCIKKPSRQPGLETEMNVLKESQDPHNVSSPW